MPNLSEGDVRIERPDPAAIFACAHSLWEYGENNMNVSETFSGADGFMRAIMKVGEAFENWACKHVAFEELNDCWPYLLQDSFGKACFEILEPEALEGFDEEDCLRVALQLKLPIRLDGDLPVPVNFTAQNPNQNSGFREFRIQSVRDALEDGDVVPMLVGDDTYDAEFGKAYFGFYGVCPDGSLEHIADRKTYSKVVELAGKLCPGISFPRFLQLTK